MERAFLDRETTIESGADNGNHTVKNNEILDMFRYGTEAEEAEALWTRGDAAQDVITAELRQMVTRKLWTPVHTHQLTDLEKGRVIRSSMFLKNSKLDSSLGGTCKTRIFTRTCLPPQQRSRPYSPSYPQLPCVALLLLRRIRGRIWTRSLLPSTRQTSFI